MIIIISGASGTGKSVLAEKLAKYYGLKCIHASDILKELCTKDDLEKRPAKKIKAQKISELKICKTKMNAGWWESEEGQKYLEERLKNTKFDLLLDKKLLEIIKNEDSLVLDSRTMPWLSKKGFKILLTASLNTRAKRIAERDKISLAKAKKAMTKKAMVERKLYKKLYGFDQEKDLEVFDLILDTDKLNQDEVFRTVVKFIEKQEQKGNTKLR